MYNERMTVAEPKVDNFSNFFVELAANYNLMFRTNYSSGKYKSCPFESLN